MKNRKKYNNPNIINSIKYILDRRNMWQHNLSCIIENQITGEKQIYDPKYVSKVINRKLKINESLQKKWSEKLQVPIEQFVDEKGYCKEIPSYEIHKLESYLDGQYEIKNEDMVVGSITDMDTNQERELKLADFQQVEIAVRKHNLETSITRMQRKIRKDIVGIKDGSIESAFDAAERNLMFYKRVLDFHQQRPINEDECKSLFKAFAYLIDNVSEDKMKEDANPLAYGLCSVIKICREVEEKKRKKAIENYIKLFGEIVYEDIDE